MPFPLPTEMSYIACFVTKNINLLFDQNLFINYWNRDFAAGREEDEKFLAQSIVSDAEDAFAKHSTGMRRITTFRSTTDCIYDGRPIRL